MTASDHKDIYIHENHCSCGHDHDHHHEHGERCSCGHDHEHHHEHGEHCSCGHDHEHHHEHGEHCSCGHDHEHHHEHGEHCSCGHDHEHHHEHDECCSCGHHHEHHHVPGHPEDCECELCHPHAEYCDICGKSLANCTCHMPDEDCEKRVYILENLGCAHCAAKMEAKIKALPGVKYATITFATKQLRLSAENHAALLPQIQEVCVSIESQVKVVPRDGKLPGAIKTKNYILENLGCAHCAAKMETQIAALEGISGATITFATKQLRVTTVNPDRYLPEIRKICADIESEVQVIDREAATPKDVTPKKHSMDEDRIDLIQIIIGAALFIGGILMQHALSAEKLSLILFLPGYLLLGGKILLEAGRNIRKGQIFDENFLMCLATLGAFAIGEYPEAMGVMLFYRIGEFFEHKAVEKSRSQIMEAVDMRPEVVNLLIGEEEQVIPAADAQVGDILLIRPGDRIPLDGVVVDGESRLDTSPITGEPVPVAVHYGDEIISGCVNTDGQLKMRVEKPLSESMVTRILDSVENAAASKPRIDRFITRFARVYTPCVVLIALATAIIPSLFTGNWNYWVYTALTFLVMSCPCALVLSVPLAFFSGIGAGSRKGILFKGGMAIEAMTQINAIVMDKTGTLTRGDFSLQKIISTGKYNENDLLHLAASCEQHSTHPIAHSIVSAARKRGIAMQSPHSMKEIPGHGVEALLDAGEVLCGNRKLMESHSVLLENAPETPAGAEVFIAVEGILAGILVISDTIKADAKSAVSRLKALGLHTAMLTGDSESSANAVAEATGIDQVHARLMPQDKLNLLTDIRNRFGGVMFVGDGINDAPVLAGADVGAAMGSGADAAIEAADAVFMTSSAESIPDAIEIARSTNRIAIQNVVFALAIKIAVMILGLCGFANMWMAVFADTGVAMLCVLNSVRVLYKKK